MDAILDSFPPGDPLDQPRGKPMCSCRSLLPQVRYLHQQHQHHIGAVTIGDPESIPSLLDQGCSGDRIRWVWRLYLRWERWPAFSLCHLTNSQCGVSLLCVTIRGVRVGNKREIHKNSGLHFVFSPIGGSQTQANITAPCRAVRAQLSGSQLKDLVQEAWAGAWECALVFFSFLL